MIRLLALGCFLLAATSASGATLRAEPELQPRTTAAAPLAARHASPGRVFPVTLGPPSAEELAQIGPPSKGMPLQVGFGRGVASLRELAGLKGALSWDELPGGGRVAAVSITSPGAEPSRVAIAHASI